MVPIWDACAAGCILMFFFYFNFFVFFPKINLSSQAVSHKIFQAPLDFPAKERRPPPGAWACLHAHSTSTAKGSSLQGPSSSAF